MERRNGLRKETPPCRNKPACAAARETENSGFLGRRSIARPQEDVDQQALDRIWALEVGKTCSPENLRTFHRLARPELALGKFRLVPRGWLALPDRQHHMIIRLFPKCLPAAAKRCKKPM